MAKRLHSQDGEVAEVVKETRHGKFIRYGFVEMSNVKLALMKAPVGADVCIVPQGLKNHGIPRDECVRVITEWKDKMQADEEEKALAFARSEMHPNCFAGNDE